MYDYLIDHALKYVWCTPNQDKQAIVKPVRLSPNGGVWNNVKIVWENIKLPVQKKRFHVYQIGQLHPELLGLFPSYMKWKRISENCTEQTMICDIYDVSGLQYPRFQCWYMLTRNKNLIIAVEEPAINTIPINFATASIYLRVYTNEYFNSHRSSPLHDKIEVVGMRVVTNNDILNLQSQYIAAASKPGTVYAFINGFKVDSISLVNSRPGDIIEFVYDSSVKAIYDFNISDLRSFVSYLDDKRKYLLHYPGNTDTIDYQDDIDVFLIKKESGNRHKGVYYHKNQEDALRMLTHKDYSTPVDLIDSFKLMRPEWNSIQDLTLRLHIRHAGYKRDLVYSNNRIHELYKLQDSEIVDSMTGIDSNVSVFQAENLEASGYTQIMRSPTSCITKELVEDAYGYNAISKLLADTPKKVRISSNQKVVDVPYGLALNSTAYEYDSNGLLIDWYSHIPGQIYSVRNSNTDIVEMITNPTTNAIEDYYNQQVVTLLPNTSYRFYTCQLHNGLPTNEWVDVTGDDTKYLINGNVCTWLTNPDLTYTLVRGDSINLGYRIQLPVINGLLRFSLQQEVMVNGNPVSKVMDVPMGYLDIFLNNHSLIEGLDYIVEFPVITILNKEYLVNPTSQDQELVIRFTGLAGKDFVRDKNWDVGFIDHGLLSYNNRFDIRDDKVLRITVDGAIYERSELEYAETDSGVTVPDARNGSPYLIRDIVPAVKDYTTEDTYSLRDKSIMIDKEVSDYLSLKIPEPTPTNPNVIIDHYSIYSPFLAKILFDLTTGVLNDPRILGHYNDNDLSDIVKDYEYLLSSDPTQSYHEIDERYVKIHPHHLPNIVDVSIYHYKLLDRIIKLYCHRKIDLSHFLRIV